MESIDEGQIMSSADAKKISMKKKSSSKKSQYSD